MTMMKLIDASYEGGVLRPAEPLHLRAGEHVRIIVVPAGDASRWELERFGSLNTSDDAALAEAGLAAWADELDAEDRR
jgi:predicted DNA-binding antitoxin AbrB/MazE fold protein